MPVNTSIIREWEWEDKQRSMGIIAYWSRNLSLNLECRWERMKIDCNRRERECEKSFPVSCNITIPPIHLVPMPVNNADVFAGDSVNLQLRIDTSAPPVSPSAPRPPTPCKKAAFRISPLPNDRLSPTDKSPSPRRVCNSLMFSVCLKSLSRWPLLHTISLLVFIIL